MYRISIKCNTKLIKWRHIRQWMEEHNSIKLHKRKIDCVYDTHSNNNNINNYNYAYNLKITTNGESVLENIIILIKFPLIVNNYENYVEEEECYDHMLKGSMLALQIIVCVRCANWCYRQSNTTK